MNIDDKGWERELPEDFQGAIDRVRKGPPPPDSLERSVLAVEGIAMTQAAWERAAMNAQMLAVFVLLADFAGTAVLVAAFGFHPLLAFMGVSYVFSMLAFLVGFYDSIHGKIRAGDLVLDCGRIVTRSKGSFPLMMLYLSVFGVIILGTMDLQQIGPLPIAAVCVWAVTGLLYWRMLSTGSLQVRTHGLWHHGFLPWDRIESWSWVGKTDLTLVILRRGWLPYLRRVAVPLPIDLRPQVEALLKANTNPSESP